MRRYRTGGMGEEGQFWKQTQTSDKVEVPGNTNTKQLKQLTSDQKWFKWVTIISRNLKNTNKIFKNETNNSENLIN